VFRADPAGGSEPVQVTTSPVPVPRGVAFDASGALLVASASPGSIVRVTLSAGAEVARETVVSAPTPYAIALDATGRIYFTSDSGGFLARIAPGGGALETLEPALDSPFSFDFGSGALPTCALFVVTGGRVTSLENDAPGAATIWH